MVCGVMYLSSSSTIDVSEQDPDVVSSCIHVSSVSLSLSSLHMLSLKHTVLQSAPIWIQLHL